MSEAAASKPNSAPIPDDVRALFDGKMLLGYVATARPDHHLSVVPVGVVIHDGQIRISSPANTFKVRNLEGDPHIAVCVPQPEDPRRYLMIRGTAEVREDSERKFLNWIARTHMGLEEHPANASNESRVVITIHPARFIMSGANE